MQLRTAPVERRSRFWSPDVMRDELSHALVEALYELEVLPQNEEARVVGISAVIDDLQDAIARTEKLAVGIRLVGGEARRG